MINKKLSKNQIMNQKKFIFLTKKEVSYTHQTLFLFKIELYALLDCILTHSLECTNESLTIKRQLVEDHSKLLNLDLENDKYKVTVEVYFKDMFNKKYDLSYATESDLLGYSKAFKSLKERLEDKRSIMYYQRDLLKFKSASLSHYSKSSRLEAFFNFYKTKKLEFFIYNQKVALQLSKRSILFVAEYLSKTFVIKFQII